MAYHNFKSADVIGPILLPFAFLFLFLPLTYSHPLGNQATPTKEENLKAVFIYNFTKYVFWSDNDTSLTFNISIIGNSDIVVPLEEIANKRKVGDREINIYRLRDINSMVPSHILFISKSESNRLSVILNQINQKNTLTISDSDGFARMGVAINFFISNGKVRFELNSKAIERAGIKVSSQLQRLAVIVDKTGA